MSGATMTIPYSEYQSLLDAIKKNAEDITQVRIELTAAKMADPTGRVPTITAFARECLTIARYAVANLPPELNKGWPYRTLFRVANFMPELPDYSIDDRDLANDLVAFGKECEQHELRRAAEPKATKMTALDVEEQRRRLEGDPVATMAAQKMQAP